MKRHTNVEPPTRCDLNSLITQRVERGGPSLALRELDGQQRELTWSQVKTESDRWARGLADLGVKPGDTILTMIPNGADTLVAWAAIAALGAIEVPLNDAFHGPSLAHAASVAKARIAIVDAQHLGQWIPDLPSLHLDHIVLPGGSTSGIDTITGAELVDLAGFSPDAEPVEPATHTADDPALVIFTSGTTGPSKGVVMSWGQWWRRAEDNALPPGYLGPDDVMYNVLPTFHAGGREIFYRAALGHGSIRTRSKFSVNRWLSDIREQRCTFTYLIGTLAKFVMSASPRPDDHVNDLRSVVYGPLGSDVEEFAKRYGVEVFTTYGSTECNNPLNSWPYTVNTTNYRSCGVVTAGREVRLVDSEGNEVPDGEVGELVVRDDRSRNQMALGYLNNPDATADAWRDGWFHTGDGFRRDEQGFYYFADRLKDAIRRRGENISAFEIETIASQIVGVTEAAAFAVPSEDMEDEVMLAVVAAEGLEIDIAELWAALKRRLPLYAVPRFIEILDELPKTPTSKVRKADLRERGVSDSTWDALASPRL